MFNGDRPRRRWHVCALNIRASAAKRLRRGLAVARVNLTTGGGGKHGSLTRSILLRGERSEGGFTFVELLVVCTIMLILAAAVMPLARVTVQRQREAELRRALREMRTAIDKFKDAADAGMIAPQDLRAGAENYPPDLNTLIEGVSEIDHHLLAAREHHDVAALVVAVGEAARRHGQLARDAGEVPAARPDGSHHPLDRVGPARVSGQTRLDVLGRWQYLRRIHEIRREGPRWHQIQRLVMTLSSQCSMFPAFACGVIRAGYGEASP